jgi:hypothetical protein
MPTKHVGRVKIENQLNLSKGDRRWSELHASGALQTATAPYLNIAHSIASQLVGCKVGDCSLLFSLVTVSTDCSPSGADAQ